MDPRTPFQHQMLCRRSLRSMGCLQPTARCQQLQQQHRWQQLQQLQQQRRRGSITLCTISSCHKARHKQHTYTSSSSQNSSSSLRHRTGTLTCNRR